MTDPVLHMDQPVVHVEPGGEVRTLITVRHGGQAVERYRLEVLGDAARWAQIDPRHVSAPPGEAGQVAEIVFRPPHAAASEVREIPFGVRAMSLEHRDRTGIVEGDVVVAAIPDLTARLEPDRTMGRWGAGHRVLLANAGHRPIAVRVSGADSLGALRFAVAPAECTVPPGGDAEALVSVRSRRPRLVGGPARHPFTVEYREEGSSTAGRLAGSFEQRAVLPLAVVALLGLVVAAGLTAVALMVLRPAPAGPAQAGATSTGPAADPTPTSSPVPAADPVSGFVVVYGPPVPVDDTVNREVAPRLAEKLRAAGVAADVVDSRESDQLDDGLKGLLVVLRDGFPDRAAAAAECAARRDIAPACVVVAPR